MASKTATPPHEQPGHRFAPWKTVLDFALRSRYCAAAWIDGSRLGAYADASVRMNGGRTLA